ncbi:MAG: hydroxymethylbilane synthase [Alphaproteobacteria bacterium]
MIRPPSPSVSPQKTAISSGLSIRLGTRASPLAKAQANLVASALSTYDPSAEIAIHDVISTGDRILDRPLADSGGKGLFTKELDGALLDGSMDIAVHSLKDVETFMAAGLTLRAVLPRADIRDALILSPKLAAANRIDSIMDLPQNAKIGTSSVRRQALLQAMRPDLNFALIRGNIQTRLAKIAAGEYDATMLAMAGLERMKLTQAGLEPSHITILPLEVTDFLPAAGQGAIGIVTRDVISDDLRTMLDAINDSQCMACVTAEREMLAILDGSCRTPIAAHARLSGDQLHLLGIMVRDDGIILSANHQDSARNASLIGKHVGNDILNQASKINPPL